VEHDDPAMRALVLQANEELAKISRTRTEWRDECEVVLAKHTIRLGFSKQEIDSLANSMSPAKVAKS
jgi:hypothetical protein